jgi:hypothetical protein
MNKDNYISVLQNKLLIELRRKEAAEVRGQIQFEKIASGRISLLHELIKELTNKPDRPDFFVRSNEW